MGGMVDGWIDGLIGTWIYKTTTRSFIIYLFVQHGFAEWYHARI